MKFAFTAKHRAIWPVASLCDALDVFRSGFHAWLNRGPSAGSRHDEVLPLPTVNERLIQLTLLRNG